MGIPQSRARAVVTEKKRDGPRWIGGLIRGGVAESGRAREKKRGSRSGTERTKYGRTKARGCPMNLADRPHRARGAGLLWLFKYEHICHPAHPFHTSPSPAMNVRRDVRIHDPSPAPLQHHHTPVPHPAPVDPAAPPHNTPAHQNNILSKLSHANEQTWLLIGMFFFAALSPPNPPAHIVQAASLSR